MKANYFKCSRKNAQETKAEKAENKDKNTQKKYTSAEKSMSSVLVYTKQTK